MKRGYYDFAGRPAVGAIMLAAVAAVLTAGGLVTGCWAVCTNRWGGDSLRQAVLSGATLVVGLAAAAVAARVLKWFKMRSHATVTAIVAMAAVVGFVAGWGLRLAIWDPRLATEPVSAMQLVHAIDQLGARHLHYGTLIIGGGALWALWFCEALLVAGLSLVLADAVHVTPLCASCERWCTVRRGVARVAVAPVAEVRARLERRDWDYFRRLAARRWRPGRCLRLDLATCSGCQSTNALSVRLIHRPWRARRIVDHLLLSSDCTRTITSLQRVPRRAPARRGAKNMRRLQHSRAA